MLSIPSPFVIIAWCHPELRQAITTFSRIEEIVSLLNASTPYRVDGICLIVGKQIRRLDSKTQYAVLDRRFDTSYPTGGYDVSGIEWCKENLGFYQGFLIVFWSSWNKQKMLWSTEVISHTRGYTCFDLNNITGEQDRTSMATGRKR
ncbi:hypothetical protein Tco_0571829 [Tanacetum coccineum]